MGEVCSTYEKYNVELIVEGSRHEANRCDCRLPLLLKSMGEVCSIYEKYNIELIAEGFEHEATRCEF